MKTFWISFVKNKKNQGCCIVDAEDDKLALQRATVLGINPGGEAMIIEMTDTREAEEMGKNRLRRVRNY